MAEYPMLDTPERSRRKHHFGVRASFQRTKLQHFIGIRMFETFLSSNSFLAFNSHHGEERSDPCAGGSGT
jgi:hypothetical protein